jgi:hypothetical protein
LEEAVKRGLAEGPQVNVPILSGHCEVAQRIAERIGRSGCPASCEFASMRAAG